MTDPTERVQPVTTIADDPTSDDVYPGEPVQTSDAYAYCLSYADMLSVPEDGPSCP